MQKWKWHGTLTSASRNNDWNKITTNLMHEYLLFFTSRNSCLNGYFHLAWGKAIAYFFLRQASARIGFFYYYYSNHFCTWIDFFFQASARRTHTKEIKTQAGCCYFTSTTKVSSRKIFVSWKHVIFKSSSRKHNLKDSNQVVKS